jgi:hypothetical protein
MDLPIGARELPRLEPHIDATIDHRNEVRVGKVVQDVTRSRTIDTTEQDITVQRRAVSLLLGETMDAGRNLNCRCGRHGADPFGRKFDLELPHAALISEEKSIKIVALYAIMINEHEPRQAHPRESFGNDSTNAP